MSAASIESAEREVAVIRTGAANLASVAAACRRAGLSPRFTTSPADVEGAPLVILPGVGAFGPAMASLRAAGLVQSLQRRLSASRPLLAICLGLQLLCEASEESPGVRGLGVIPGVVERFPSSVAVPQFGWNAITVPDPGGVLESGFVYFANSYRLRAVPAGWRAASCQYGGPFVAALEQGPVLACQFHPELSGSFGLGLLRRWAERGGGAGAEGKTTAEATPC